MVNQTSACYDVATLERFLDECLHEHQEAAITAHIDGCALCQQRLERVAAHRDAWEDVKFNLGDHPRLGSDDETLAVGERDRRVELDRLKDYLSPTDDPAMIGRIGPYEVCGIVGQGSTGVVVKALEPRLNRYVAIKILSPSFSSNGPARTRFEREGRAIAAVTHENVVPIYAVDEHRGLPYIVMQYAPGGSLLQRIERDGPLDTCEVARIGMQIAKGLAAAHAQGLIHRDVKPANVMLETGVDRAMVTDFGLARVADEAAMTRSGVISGTPQYMSPEQARGDMADPRSDLFSLGSVLYTACTGHAPFRSETVFGVIKRVCETDPRPIRELNPDIEPWLAALVDKLHAKDTDERFASAEQVADILAHELAHMNSPLIIATPPRPWMQQAPRRAPWIAAAAILAGVSVSLAIYEPKTRTPAPTTTTAPAGAVTAPVVAVPPEPRQIGITLEAAAPGATVPEPTEPGRAARMAGVPEPPAPATVITLPGAIVAPAPAVSVRPATPATTLEPHPVVPSAPAAPGRPGRLVTIEKYFRGGVVDGYTLYLPQSYGATASAYPVIVYLAGGQTVGGRVSSVNDCGLPRLLQRVIRNTDVPGEVEAFLRDTFIVVAPHLKDGKSSKRQYYDYGDAIDEILDEVTTTYAADTSRLYLTGAGRGGHGTWGLASRRPERFAAFAPVSGVADGIRDFSKLTTLPLWAAHNTRDRCVPYAETVRTVLRVESAGGEPFLQVLSDDTADVNYASHSKIFTTIDATRTTESVEIYKNPDLYRWLLLHRKSPAGDDLR